MQQHATTTTRLLRHDYYDTTTTTRLLRHDYYDKTTTTRLLRQDYYDTTTTTRLLRLLRLLLRSTTITVHQRPATTIDHNDDDGRRRQDQHHNNNNDDNNNYYYKQQQQQRRVRKRRLNQHLTYWLSQLSIAKLPHHATVIIMIVPVHKSWLSCAAQVKRRASNAWRRNLFDPSLPVAIACDSHVAPVFVPHCWWAWSQRPCLRHASGLLLSLSLCLSLSYLHKFHLRTWPSPKKIKANLSTASHFMACHWNCKVHSIESAHCKVHNMRNMRNMPAVPLKDT